MADLETRLHDALGDAGSHTHPSPDLFARVVGSIAEDRARRRRVRTIALLWVAGVALLALLTVTLTPKDEEGMHMPWWILELATNVVLVGIALWLGPFIKRFGRAYAADVFHDNPQTGKSYIVLTDIVYYLIFTAYILFTIRVDAPVVLPGRGARGPGEGRARADRRHPADHRHPARAEPGDHARARPAVLPEPSPASS